MDTKGSIVPDIRNLSCPDWDDDCELPIDDSWSDVHRLLGHQLMGRRSWLLYPVGLILSTHLILLIVGAAVGYGIFKPRASSA